MELIKSRQKDTDGKDDAFCTMLMTINPDENGDEFLYVDRTLEYIEKNPSVSLKNIRDYIISLRPNVRSQNIKEAV